MRTTTRIVLTDGPNNNFTVGPNGMDTTTSNTTWMWQDQIAIAPGYCFDCEQRVQVEYYRRWISSVDGDCSPGTCSKCGGHEVEFLDRVGLHLLERIEKLEATLHMAQKISYL